MEHRGGAWAGLGGGRAVCARTLRLATAAMHLPTPPFSLLPCAPLLLDPQVRDAIYAAIRLPLVDRHIRHEKHWKYVSNHTVQFWAKVSAPAACAAPWLRAAPRLQALRIVCGLGRGAWGAVAPPPRACASGGPPLTVLSTSLLPHPVPRQSNVADLQRFTKDHSKLQCFDLGFALDTFRMVRALRCAAGGAAGNPWLMATR